MGSAECFMQIQLYAINTQFTKLHLPQYGIQVGAITNQQSAPFMDELAYLQYLRVKQAQGIR